MKLIIRSIKWRIALWHVLLFIGMSLIFASTVYSWMKSYMMYLVDQQLIEKVKRNEWYANDDQYEVIQGHMKYCMQIEGVDSHFYVVFNANGDVFVEPKFEEWKLFFNDREFVTFVSENGIQSYDFILNKVAESYPQVELQQLDQCPGISHLFFLTVKHEKESYRLVVVRLANAKVMLCGRSLAQNHFFFEQLRQAFTLLFLATTFFGSLAGLFLGNRSIAPMKKITQTASEINHGNLNLRAETNRRCDLEMLELSTAFNEMLNRIQQLVNTLKQVTDDVAHDLRTPIARIRATAEMAISHPKPDAERQFCSIIEECDGLIAMINANLEIAQSNAGTLKFPLEQLDVTEMLDKGFLLFKPLFEDEGILLKSDLPDHPVWILGNKGKLQRALSNLLDNAMKFTEPNGEVYLGLKEVEEDVLIYVQDNGIGIPPEDRKLIFDRFYRGDPSRSVSGNGLGLCMVDAIVRAHGGDVFLQSKVGKGSTFTMKFSKSNVI